MYGRLDWSVEHRCKRCDCLMYKSGPGNYKKRADGSKGYGGHGYCLSCAGVVRKEPDAKKAYRVQFDANGQVCGFCNKYQPFVNFKQVSDDRSLSGYFGQCKVCCLIKRHNLTRADYDSMLNKQNNSCAICFQSTTTWHIDHDHKCCPGKLSCGKCVRGILYGPCNTGIGMLKEDPTIMLSAIEYLEREN